MERLDRAFGNSLLKFMFPNVMVSHLSRSSSDHCPIIVDLLRVDVLPPKKFQFEYVLFGHIDFFKVIFDSWDMFPQFPLQTLKACSLSLTWWNKHVFSNVFKMKRRLLARIKGVQFALQDGPNSFLINLDSKLNKDYQFILNQEEEL
ncbi:hypothetical protein CFOL_v3_22272 [Cephalotus follicularis]|uniref:Exo_endo_phos domain-containing protein n=1 Tax=Cephalotus follicularis TaxID=3775 RepID=A0A1Q3CF23_CEPFO|nr:hypothetical protein CFOL_v3_22272 [Cephalotus follicularis]